jgi:TatA/E family protein of Tat protein translocase
VFRNPLIDAIVVLVVVLLIFGPKRLPALGQGMREFKETITGDSTSAEGELPGLPAPATAPITAQQAGEAEQVERGGTPRT